ncbi:hypothetical protein O181_086963 [Austropuccinia psidii MF-1]|uniref:Uncharacterized protein n=1 Tax=Austropuccinia psidii MF-1 TaxID=1389203 RepID=A0A9Q3P0D3_9BASI|nr:hypothetical protein [Austropuccinia psidii MF-1]
MDRDYCPQGVEAVGGLNGLFGPFRPKPPLMKGGGPNPKMMARGPTTPWNNEGPPRHKIKDKGLGVGDMEIGQGGQ